MGRIVLLMLVIGAFQVVALGAVQPSMAPRKGGNPDAAKAKNPVAATESSIVAGKRAYQRLCIRCHGPEGKGDGTATTSHEPSDLTGTKWDYGKSDGEIFGVVHDGVSVDMEPYSSRISDEEIWNLVNYLRTLRSEKP